MFVILLFCLLRSAIFAADLKDLVSASNDFEVEMIDQEHVLERNPSATEIAASTIKYVKAKERHFVALRKIVPTLIDMATGKTPKTPEVDKIREIFSGYGETQERQSEAATVSMLKERDQDAEVSKAEIEFYRVQKVEQQFHKDFYGLDST
jgi:phosphopentomutase